MYATAHLVRSSAGDQGINTFLHVHGSGHPWPAEPWRMPEMDPGREVRQQIAVRPGGNDVLAYLDVIAPDDVAPAELDAALTGLWLELVADEAGPSTPLRRLPNPLVYRRGRVVLRIGVQGRLVSARVQTLGDLRGAVEPLMEGWRGAA